MNQAKAEAIVERLLRNAADLKYGIVSITAKIHNGRLAEIIYSTTESTREVEGDTAKAKPEPERQPSGA